MTSEKFKYPIALNFLPDGDRETQQTKLDNLANWIADKLGLVAMPDFDFEVILYAGYIFDARAYGYEGNEYPEIVIAPHYSNYLHIFVWAKENDYHRRYKLAYNNNNNFNTNDGSSDNNYYCSGGSGYWQSMGFGIGGGSYIYLYRQSYENGLKAYNFSSSTSVDTYSPKYFTLMEFNLKRDNTIKKHLGMLSAPSGNTKTYFAIIFPTLYDLNYIQEDNDYYDCYFQIDNASSINTLGGNANTSIKIYNKFYIDDCNEIEIIEPVYIRQSNTKYDINQALPLNTTKKYYPLTCGMTYNYGILAMPDFTETT